MRKHKVKSQDSQRHISDNIWIYETKCGKILLDDITDYKNRSKCKKCFKVDKN